SESWRTTMHSVPCPENLEQIVIDVVSEIAADNGTTGLSASMALSDDVGLSSIETFEVFALLDARLMRRFPYESLILSGNTAKEDLTIQEIVDFVRQN